jgi:MHS family citrate/tricarballylate:H+ symporter-like MFS transporter
MTERPAGSAISPRHVSAAVIGNALEFYDFTTFAYFASQIGRAFFPNHSHFVSLMLALGAFGAGFVLRPVGSLVLGRYADRHGRRPAMLISFALMGVGIVGLAVTPSYSSIGILAPIIVVTLRLCQGFALGGEVGPTTAYLIEAAPPYRRGLYAAWQNVSQNLAAIVGGSMGVILSLLIGAADLDDWGWRIAFGLGALILPIGLILRRNLPETLNEPEAITHHQPATTTLTAHARIIALGLALIAAATVSTYSMTYMTTYARETLKLSGQVSLAAPIINGASGALFGLIGGVLSDRYGRRAMMIWPRVFFILALWPVFYLMARDRDAPTLFVGIFVLAGASALTTASVFVAIAESLRKEVRGLALGGVYAIAVAVFGGGTQPAITWLIHQTGDPLSPAWCGIVFAVAGLVASMMMRETAPSRTGSVLAQR